jgi:hypothetical protein
LQNGQSASVLTGLSNSFGVTNASDAGAYTLRVAGSLTNSNYTVSSANTGSWTVIPAAVTVTALGGSSIYGSAPSNPGLSATGLQNGQSVGVLTGLANSFGVSASSRVGSYVMNVVGALTNANYTLTSTKSSDWTVMPLRGSLVDRSWPLNGAMSVKAPPTNGGNSALDGLNNGSSRVNVGAAGSVGLANAASLSRTDADGPSGAPPPGPNRGTGVGAGFPVTGPAPASTSVPAPTQLEDAFTNSAAATASCADVDNRGDGSSANASSPGAASDPQSLGCGSAPKASGLMDRALSSFNREAIVAAVSREFAEAEGAASGSRATLNVALAGGSVMLSVGFVSWLLRGEALLSALLSSMPLWRGFDPLVIMMRPKRRDEDADRPPTDVDRMFTRGRS